MDTWNEFNQKKHDTLFDQFHTNPIIFKEKKHFVYQKLSDKRQKLNPNLKIGYLMKTTDKKFFLKVIRQIRILR